MEHASVGENQIDHFIELEHVETIPRAGISSSHDRGIVQLDDSFLRYFIRTRPDLHVR